MPPRIVILTALPIEYTAVRAHLTDLREETHPQGTVYERGKFATNGQVWEVGIAEVGAGNASAAIEAERAIAHFKPDLLFFVGIAGGIKDVAIGDVVAVTKVYGYESGKAGEQFFTRPEVGQSTHALVQRSRAEARKEDWLQRLSDTPARPRAVLGAIAAGEKVIASRQSEVFQLLRTSYNDAIAVEMEGYGFLRAAFAYPEVKAIVIRGISDLIEGKNDASPESGQEPEEIRQAKASRHASAFAFEVLAKLQIEEADTSRGGAEEGLPGQFISVNQQPTSESLTVFQRQRLEEQRNSLQEEWNLRNGKLAQLRKAFAIEAGAAAKFQLEQQIQAETEAINRLELALSEIEQNLNHSSDSPTPQTDSQQGVESSKRTSPNFFAYDDAWVGRESLIHELSDLVRRNTRLLMLVGITGIGKTALGERLTMEVADWFENDWSNYHQENFDDEQHSSDFASVAARWLEKWGEVITPDDRKDPQQLLYRLIQHLRENRYLVQMDSLENILQGNEDEGWSDFKDEWWVQFFDRYLKAESCESCIILTSQDLPRQIEEVGTRSQNFWHCQLLSGLEKPERMALFKKTDLNVEAASVGRRYLERIGEAYEGHPLALRVIAGEIKNRPFSGDILAYWNRYGSEVEEVERAIADAQAGQTMGANDQWKLDRFTRTLRRNVKKRLEQTFQRLRQDVKYAYILLCESSVYRCAVPEDWWLSHLEYWDQDNEQQLAAINALRDRFLIEEVIIDSQYLVRQHNLIRSTSLEHLKALDDSNE